METLYKFHGGIVAYLTFLTQIKVEVLDVGDGDFLHGNVRQLVFLLQELYHPLFGKFVARVGLLRGSLADLLCILFIVLGEVADECFLLFLQSQECVPDFFRQCVTVHVVDDGSSRFRVPVIGVYIQLAAELHLITVHRDTYHYYYMTVFLRFVLL